MKTITLDNAAVHHGDLILVNAQYPYRDTLPLKSLAPACGAGSPVFLDIRAAAVLDRLLADIGAGGRIVPVSGWRSKTEQEALYAGALAGHGPDYTRKFVALPGHSEHETGLAIDLAQNSNAIDFICPDFPDTGVCRAFRRAAAAFGFVERYPKGKEPCTGIAHEPWHFRYVGRPHAALMAEYGWCLEEYIGAVKSYPFGGRPLVLRGCQVAYLPLGAGGRTSFTLPDGTDYALSGNNADGFLLTTWEAAR